MRDWEAHVLDMVPHGEEGSIQLSCDDAITVQKCLIENGFVTCLSHGDIGGEYKLSWIYAGDSEDVKYSNYSQVCFTHVDFINDMVDCYYQAHEKGEEDEGDKKV